jgi:hypothetical protein
MEVTKMKRTLALLVATLSLAAFRGNDPETVHVSFRPKAHAEADLKRVIAEHWAAARRLNLVHPEPHVTLEMKDEAGRPYFVDVFTWRDRDIPDHAPQPILEIWAEMTRLTEDRGGRPGVEIQEVTLASGVQ